MSWPPIATIGTIVSHSDVGKAEGLPPLRLRHAAIGDLESGKREQQAERDEDRVAHVSRPLLASAG